MLTLLWLLKCQWVFLVVGVSDLPLLSTAGTPHPHTMRMPLSLNYRNLSKWQMGAVVTGIFMPLNQPSSIDLIVFKRDYIWGSDCQGNTSGNLFCLFTSCSLLLYSWSLAGYFIVTGPYASSSKQRCFLNLSVFLIIYTQFVFLGKEGLFFLWFKGPMNLTCT